MGKGSKKNTHKKGTGKGKKDSFKDRALNRWILLNQKYRELMEKPTIGKSLRFAMFFLTTIFKIYSKRLVERIITWIVSFFS